MAEDLAAGIPIPLGKYLLGSVYHMLHQTTYLMHTSKKIPCVNGPWWFVQMWLQLYMHQIVAIDLNNRHPLCLELMPDFQPTSEVICSFPFLTSVFNHTPPH
jgi:hypothetical protein